MIGKEIFHNGKGRCKILDKVNTLRVAEFNKKEYAVVVTKYLVKIDGSSDVALIDPNEIMYLYE